LAASFKVSTDAQQRQLPSIVLLEESREYLRFPPIDEKNKQGRLINWKERELVKYFDFDLRHAATKHLK
jgi:hypothetical protein